MPCKPRGFRTGSRKGGPVSRGPPHINCTPSLTLGASGLGILNRFQFSPHAFSAPTEARRERWTVPIREAAGSWDKDLLRNHTGDDHIWLCFNHLQTILVLKKRVKTSVQQQQRLPKHLAQFTNTARFHFLKQYLFCIYSILSYTMTSGVDVFKHF